MLTNQQLIERSFDLLISDVLTAEKAEEMQDDDLREDWAQAQFYLRRILRRLYQQGEFEHVGI